MARPFRPPSWAPQHAAMTEPELDAVAAALRGLAAVSERMVTLTGWMRQLPDVTSATLTCDIRGGEPIARGGFQFGRGDGYWFAWYAEAEFGDGVGLSFAIELTSPGVVWTIDGWVAAETTHGQVGLLELPTARAESPSKMSQALLDTADELDRRRENALRLRATHA